MNLVDEIPVLCYFLRGQQLLLLLLFREGVMGTPRKLEVPLTVHGYSLRLDTVKADCIPEDRPHWHLMNHGQRIGTISAFGEWLAIKGEITPAIRQEVEEMTSLYSRRIQTDYQHNALMGDEY